ncbi:prephenate dehydratase [Arachnomyces sp. PD_36]|nr:prephenate dehydratase [Arachnomyces sp. PD_36]
MLENPRVAFLGPAASFSHQATLESFGRKAILSPLTSFRDVFAALQSKEVDYAVVPFENSTNGSVVQALDLLADRDKLFGDIAVCGEHYLTVHHCLLVYGLKNVSKQGTANGNDRGNDSTTNGGGEDKDSRYKSITKLYTHPQAWGQCEKFLSKHFKGVERQDVSSTSKAAQIVSEQAADSNAAIASKLAAEHHDLEILSENIEDDSGNNTTRFLILRNVTAQGTEGRDNKSTSGEGSEPQTKWKTLVSFMINHTSPGALADALVIFKAHGMNLTSINTRPSLVRPWQYVFFVECARIQGVHDDDVVCKILKDLQEVTESCRDLGTWMEQQN